MKFCNFKNFAKYFETTQIFGKTSEVLKVKLNFKGSYGNQVVFYMKFDGKFQVLKLKMTEIKILIPKSNMEF